MLTLLTMVESDSAITSGRFNGAAIRLITLLALAIILTGCSSRQVQDSLTGSTAQRLVTHAIDEMILNLPEADFEPLRDRRLFVESNFIEYQQIRHYADRRLAVELRRRFGIEVVEEPLAADERMTVFYTSLGTDQGLRGFFLPLGFIPGVDETVTINLITLEQFHGVAEMYYYIGQPGSERRGSLIQARMRTDAIGLPIITIPISSVDRR